MKTAARPGVILVASLLVSIPAYARTATAERLDAIVRVQPGGTLDVTETLVFRYEGGPFTELVRELPRRRIDGLEIRELWMDGRRIVIGDAVGQARVEGSFRNRIRWRFAPTTSSSRTFRIRYVVRGAVREDERGDLLTWRIPGGEHQWRVESSTVEYELGSAVAARAAIRVNRTDRASWERHEAGVRVTSRGTRSNGWTETTLTLPAGAILAGPPAWQVAQRQRAAYGPVWFGAAGMLFVAGLIPLFAVRQGYDKPRRESGPGAPVESLPDSLPAPIAGAVANGKPSLEHAAATLFALAARGGIRVSQDRRTFGRRTYLLARVDSRQPLTPWEQAALDAAFEASPAVTLSKARRHLSRRFKPFSHALMAAMHAEGLLDQDRQATRAVYIKVAAGEFVLAGLTFIAWPLIMSVYGPWPLVVAGALTSAALVALTLYGTSTPLSNEGVRRADAWKAYKKHLRAAAKGSTGLADSALPYAIALGLAGEWSKHLKTHPVRTPDWFQADDADAYSAFIAAAGAGPSGHPHGAAV